MTRLAVFDCDGTLVDSQRAICTAMAATFAASGLVPPTRTAVVRVVGLNLVEAMAVLLPDADDTMHRRLAEAYKRAFQALRIDGLVEEPLYDEVADAIATLRARSWQLGVATGKSDRGLRLCLDHHAIARHFVTLQTADHHPSKPHPAMLQAAMAEAGARPADTVMIGDTSFDMAMAKAAGARAIGVTWGYHDAVDLRRAGADAIVRTPAELLSELEAA